MQYKLKHKAFTTSMHLNCI